MVTIRPYQDNDLTQVLALLEKSDSTSRTHETWRGNDMTAVLAFEGEHLIGAIPFEKRQFVLSQEKIIPVLWASGVHVEPEYRSQGVGSSLDQKIEQYFFPLAQAVLVFREDETSPAYRWYKKLGYHDLLPILSFKKEVESPLIKPSYVVWQTQEEIQTQEHKLFDFFQKNIGSFYGYPKRHEGFWSGKFVHHYYKKSYSYSVLALRRGEQLMSYAFLGKTAMRDGIERLDILEMITPEDQEIKNNLYQAIVHFASRLAVKEIRIQLSYQDFDAAWMKSRGFTLRWRTNVLGKFINPIQYAGQVLSEIVDLNREYSFLWQTPGLGQQRIGTGEKYLGLFSHDQILHEILFGRCDIEAALKQGKLVVLGGDDNNLAVLKKVFAFNPWRYFHIDYC